MAYAIATIFKVKSSEELKEKILKEKYFHSPSDPYAVKVEINSLLDERNFDGSIQNISATVLIND